VGPPVPWERGIGHLPGVPVLSERQIAEAEEADREIRSTSSAFMVNAER
jgi:hypothetical protein